MGLAKGNDILKPDWEVKASSKREVWWKCRKGHEWQEVVRDRVRWGGACSACLVEARGR